MSASQGGRLRRNALLVLSFDIAARMCGAAATLLIIRLLPTGEYAEYTLALAIVGLVTQTIASGINRIYILSYARLGLREGSGALLGLQWVVGALSAFGLSVLLHVSAALVIPLIAMALALIAADFVKTEFQRVHAFKRYSYVEIVRTAGFLLLLGVIMFAGKVHWNARVVVEVQAGVIGAVSLPLLYRLRLTRGLVHVRKGLLLIRAVVAKPRGQLFAYFLVLAGLSQLDVFMLRSLADRQALASYGVAFRYYGLLLTALNAVHTVLLPAIAEVESGRGVRDIFRKHRSLVGLFSLGVGLSVLAAPWLMPIINGGRYPQAIAVFQVLAISAAISFAFSPHANVLMRFERYRLLFALVTAAAVLSLTLNWLLIPLYGALGAALTTLTAFGVMNIATYFGARRVLALTEGRLPSQC